MYEKNSAVLIYFSYFCFTILAQELPKQMTEEEKILWRTYVPSYNPEFSTPPPTTVRTMAEWEELQGIVITWSTQYTILTGNC